MTFARRGKINYKMAITQTPYRVQPAFNEVTVVDSTANTLTVSSISPSPADAITLRHVLAEGGSRFDLKGFLSKLFYDGRQAIETEKQLTPWAFVDGRLIVSYRIAGDMTPYYVVNGVRQLGESLDLLSDIRSPWLTDRAKLNERTVHVPCYEGFPVGVSAMFGADYEVDLSDAFTVTIEIAAGQEFKPPFVDDGTRGGLILWGDGSVDGSTTTPRTHVYESSGTYTVQFLAFGGGSVSVNRTNESQYRVYQSALRTVEVMSSRIKDVGFYRCTGLHTVRDVIKHPETRMSYMFAYCSALVDLPDNFSINISPTSIAARYADYSFDYCTSLETVPDGIFSGITNLFSAEYAFRNCTKLKYLPDNLFPGQTMPYQGDGGKIRSLFSNCTSLETIPVRDFFANLGEGLLFADSTFNNCTSLKAIPGNLFSDNAALRTMGGTFYRCTSLTEIPSDLFRNNTALTEFRDTFGACTGLTAVPDGLFDPLTNVTSFRQMFQSCSNLKTVSSRIFANTTRVTNTSYMFSGASITSSISSILEPLLDLTDASHMFDRCPVPVWSGTVFANNSMLQNVAGFNAYNPNFTSIPADLFTYAPNVNNVTGFFQGWTGLTEARGNIFTSLVGVIPGGASNMFRECRNLTAVSEQVFAGLSRVTDMSYAFMDCPALGDVPAAIFDPMAALQTATQIFFRSGLTDLPAGLFSGCANLTNLADAFGNTKISLITTAFVEALPAGVQLYNLFQNMPELTTVEDGAFDSRASTTSAMSVLRSNPKLVNVPRDLFRECKNIAVFNLAFSGDSRLNGQFTFKDNGLELWERQGQPGYPASITGNYCYQSTGMIVEGGGSIPASWL